MTGLGTIVNVGTILAGGAAGLALKKLIPERLAGTITQGLGLAVIIIGLSGTFTAAFRVDSGRISFEHTLMMIISLALGALGGELIGIERRLDSLGERVRKLLPSADGSPLFVQGFVTATLVFCVGAMSIVGALEDGAAGNPNVLFAKSALDGISSMIFASAMGAGVLFSAAVVALYQGLITALSVFIAPVLGEEVISEMSLVGSVLILGIGLNMLKCTKIKIGNMLPAIFMPVAYYGIRMIFKL